MLEKDIIIISKKKELNTYLKSNKANAGLRCKYLDLSDRQIADKISMNSYGYTNIFKKEVNAIDSKQFIKMYLEMISDIGIENDNKLWWSSELASKNRFTTKLPEYIMKYIQFKKAVNEPHYDILLILVLDNILNISVCNHFTNTFSNPVLFSQNILQKYRCLLKNIFNLVSVKYLSVLRLIKEFVTIYFKFCF